MICKEGEKEEEENNARNKKSDSVLFYVFGMLASTEDSLPLKITYTDFSSLKDRVMANDLVLNLQCHHFLLCLSVS